MKETQITLFKSLFDSKGVPHYVTLEKAVSRIKNGKSKDLIEKIRVETDKDKKSKLKNQSISILFNGTFSERNASGLIEHSGLMITDFDKYESTEVMLDHFETLKQNKHFVLLFISPSGNGIKGVVKIPKCDSKEHSRYFKEFALQFKYDYFDNANSDVSRVCFESYDPNIFVNYDAEEFAPSLIDEGFTVSEKVPLVPISDDDKIIEKIMKFNWNKDFVEGERNSFVFDLAGMFCEYGVSERNALGYIFNNIVYGDFTERETENTVKSAYKKRSFGCKFFEDYTKIQKIKSEVKNGKDYILKNYNVESEVFDQIKEDVEHEDFWSFEYDKNGKQKVKVDPLKYKRFLERNGFNKYFPSNANKPTWVYVKSNKVRETSVEKIKDFVLGYLMERQEFEVWSYVANYQNLFAENFLLMLDTIELMMLRDTKKISYISFKNGILKVTKEKAELIDYIDVNGYVWENQIIQRDYAETLTYDNDYKTFIKNISSNDPKPFECMIGYLLSTFKNKLDNKAIILNDEVISDNPEGGTGKGLFVQGVKQIRRVSILDGKSFDDKKSFPYQTVSQETQILVFDDVKRNFDFEGKFSLVTEGMTLERKNKDAIKLTVEESPKLVISTNYAIKGEGNSHDRRRFEVEIAQYYGKDKTPYTDFDRQLFDDWSEDEFQRFDNYMVFCLTSYLKYGLIPQKAKNIKLRKFIAETSMEFFDWASDTINLPLNRQNNKQDFFNAFVKEYKDYDNWLRRKKFNIWIKKYCSFIGKEYAEGGTTDRWFSIGEVVNIDEENENPF